MPPNVAAPFASPVFCTTVKKPVPLIDMLVGTLDDTTLPAIVLVSCDWASTEPATSRFGVVSDIRSTKLVSMRLYPVVCEFAMFPEMLLMA